MNRLWIRLSLTFTAVLVFVLMMLPASFILLDSPDETDSLTPEQEIVLEELRREFTERFPRPVLRVLIFAGLVAISAGVWFSHSLTAPLSKLAEAAKAIGSQDLSRRVAVSGSQEVQDLAYAFNEMAADLERAETVRSNLLADVAHELRTPITVIQGNLRAILDDVYPLEKEEIARLYDQTRQLSRLVHDLRELAQAEAHRLPLDKVTVNLVALVKETAESFRMLADTQQVMLRVELLGNMNRATLCADRARLTQCLQNLMQNGLRHTPPGGTITVQLEIVEAMAIIRVIDTGEGIAAEHLAYVFDRFYRTDVARSRDTGGSGLGLAIVRAIVESHGGSVAVASDGPGRGTTFTIQLPLND